jgi:hypothetical protein
VNLSQGSDSFSSIHPVFPALLRWKSMAELAVKALVTIQYCDCSPASKFFVTGEESFLYGGEVTVARFETMDISDGVGM